MKKKPTNKQQTPTPEYDSTRQQNVLLEKISSDVKTVAEGHSILDRKIDKVDSELNEVKSGLNELKSEVNTMQMVIKDLDIKTARIEKKLDTVTQDHEDRLKKLEAVS